MNGLKDWEPDDEKRYKHIVENMIYVCEIQPKNMFLYMCAVDPFDKYKLNIYTGSFLEAGFDKHIKEVWRLDSFDLVVGNPPYNWSDGENQRKNNRENLWTRFVFKSTEILNESGFMSLITPKSWMSPSDDFGKKSIIRDIMIKYNPIFINIDDCSKHFINVGSTFSFYTIQKSNNSGISKIKTIDDYFDFSFNEENKSIPTIFNSKTISISNKFFNNKLKFNFKQKGVTTRNEKFYDIPKDEYIFENFHTHSKNKIYSRFQSDNKDLNKIIICLSGEYKSIIDTNKISHTNMSCVDIISDENVSNLDIILNSKLYNFIMNKLYKYNGWVNMKCVQNLPKPDMCFQKNIITEQELYEYFNLTPEEIQLIEETIQEPTKKRKSKKK